jgi:hypothetical protein
MSDNKSKMPDFKELASMTSKFFKDMKASLGEIIQDYKKGRAQSEAKATKTAEKPKAPEKPKTEKPEAKESKTKEDSK